MKLNRGLRGAMEGLLAATLIFAAGPVFMTAAQAKAPASQAKKPAASTARKTATKKAPARKTAVRQRGQTAPTRERIVEIQEALGQQGFYSGTPSGKWDATTSDALRNFQISQGLTATGKLGAQSLQKLGLGSEITGKAAPVPQADTRPSVLSDSEINGPEPVEPASN
jgi:peptidoglycan hydrolase-like protein with peptidoglycan-binding domain